MADRSEKRAALSHFQPKGVLMSHGPERADRRRFNEAVLDSDRAVHCLADRFVFVVNEEAEHFIAKAESLATLTWNTFAAAWFRVVWRVVFGDRARGDRELMDLLARLRARGKWSLLGPGRPRLRDQFLDHLQRHLDRAEPGGTCRLTPASG